jgi:hypothetical protein
MFDYNSYNSAVDRPRAYKTIRYCCENLLLPFVVSDENQFLHRSVRKLNKVIGNL